MYKKQLTLRPKNRCRSLNRFCFLKAVQGAARRRKLQHSTSGGRNQRQRIFSYPKRTLLLDHIFNHSATSTFGWYFFRATNSMLTATGFVTEAYLMLATGQVMTSGYRRENGPG